MQKLTRCSNSGNYRTLRHKDSLNPIEGAVFSDFWSFPAKSNSWLHRNYEGVRAKTKSGAPSTFFKQDAMERTLRRRRQAQAAQTHVTRPFCWARRCRVTGDR